MLRVLNLSPLFLLAACVGTSDAPTAAAQGRECFNVGQVSGFSERDGPVVRVHASVNRSYDLELVGPSCDDVGWAGAIAIDSVPSRWLCVGDRPTQGRVRFRDTASRRVISCQIASVARVEQPAVPQ